MKVKIEKRKVSDIKELPGNPRIINDKQFNKLKKSIKDNPDYFEARPIILSDRTGELVVIAGNQRLKAARALGLDDVPTALIPNLTEKREREIIIRDNVENGEWDFDELNSWDTNELAAWGIDEFDKETVERIEEDEAPELDDDKPDSVLGGGISTRKAQAYVWR